MGLITNGYRNGFSPFRSYSGATVSYLGGRSVRNDYLTGRMRCMSLFAGRQVAVPMGNLAPSAWLLPQTGGAMSMRARGAGILAGDLIPTQPMSIDLTGAGDLEATAGLIVSMLLAMTGAGDLTATIEGRLNASVDFTGSGDLTASMTALANMVVELLGAGDLDATISAFGNMEIDIVVTGTGLSTANVGQAVWSALLEAGFTAEDLLRLAAAGAAGKLSGAAGTTIGVRDVSDQHDIITATVDGDGNRTAVVLDLDQ
jgi:hypothetical protein